MRQSTVLFLIIAFLAGIAATLLATHLRGGQSQPAPASADEPAQTKVLYWYDPMVPQQHFDQPGKSPFMDMELVPKYADSGDKDDGSVRISPRLTQNLGMRTARVSRGALVSAVRVSGSVAFDERAISVVQARVAGIVEHLSVRAPLESVQQGQPLLTLLAPDWTSAQEEYLSLRQTSAKGLEDLRSAARQRLLLLGMGEAQVRALERSGTAQSRITLVAPRDGVVADLAVREGAKVEVGDPLLSINGLDNVWIEAAIPETQIGRVARGSQALVQLPAFPGETFEASIEALLPEINPTTRTQIARIVIANPQQRLSPGMFAWISVRPAQLIEPQLLVPSEAIIASGTRQVVVVDLGDGLFRPQQVRTGDEADGMTEILQGLEEGDTVVVSGQFLIDSEASLSGAMARLDSSEDARPAAEMPVQAAPPASGRQP